MKQEKVPSSSPAPASALITMQTRTEMPSELDYCGLEGSSRQSQYTVFTLLSAMRTFQTVSRLPILDFCLLLSWVGWSLARGSIGGQAEPQVGYIPPLDPLKFLLSSYMIQLYRFALLSALFSHLSSSSGSHRQLQMRRQPKATLDIFSPSLRRFCRPLNVRPDCLLLSYIYSHFECFSSGIELIDPDIILRHVGRRARVLSSLIPYVVCATILSLGSVLRQSL